MKLIEKQENEISGKYYFENGKILQDVNCYRIEWLIENHLKFISDSKETGVWEKLYLDPNDNRFWERTFLQSEMHGGGPPTLRYVEYDEVKEKYNI